MVIIIEDSQMATITVDIPLLDLVTTEFAKYKKSQIRADYYLQTAYPCIRIKAIQRETNFTLYKY